MCRIRLLARLCFASILLLQCGCPSSSRTHTYPEDPLFVSKKPVESTPSSVTPPAPVFAEPQIPPVPAVVRLAVKP
jgi:hypothetical protein